MFLSILVLVVTWDSGPPACGWSYQTWTIILLPAVEGTPRPVDLHQRHRLCRVAAIWRQENRRHPTTVGETQSKIFVVGVPLVWEFYTIFWKDVRLHHPNNTRTITNT